MGQWFPTPTNWLVFLRDDGVLGGILRDSGGNEIRAFNTVDVGEWSHVALTFGKNDKLRLYVNGQQGFRSDDGAGNKTKEDEDVTKIGDVRFGSGSYDGQIDDVRLYEDILPAEVVKELANPGSG